MMNRFYTDLYAVVDDPSSDSIISWSKSNKSFVIWDRKEFVRSGIFAKYCGEYMSTLLGYLRVYGFERIKGSGRHLEFGHTEYFVRGHPELMDKMLLEVVEKTQMKVKAKAQGKKAADCFQGLRI